MKNRVSATILSTLIVLCAVPSFAQNPMAIYHNGQIHFYVNPTTTETEVLLPALDLGDDNPGPLLFIGMNTNSTNSNPGTLGLHTSSGGEAYLWVTSSGLLRIHNERPGGAVSDSAGTVVGSQTSSRDAKNILGPFLNHRQALDTILRTPLYRFTYKNDESQSQQFVGLVTDEAPEFGQYPDERHPNGRALNVVNSVGYLMAAVKAQQDEIEGLKSEVASLLEVINKARSSN